MVKQSTYNKHPKEKKEAEKVGANYGENGDQDQGKVFPKIQSKFNSSRIAVS